MTVSVTFGSVDLAIQKNCFQLKLYGWKCVPSKCAITASNNTNATLACFSFDAFQLLLCHVTHIPFNYAYCHLMQFTMFFFSFSIRGNIKPLRRRQNSSSLWKYPSMYGNKRRAKMKKTNWKWKILFCRCCRWREFEKNAKWNRKNVCVRKMCDDLT